MKPFFDRALTALLVICVIAVLGGCVSFQKGLYHRKHPGTTTLDWILDPHK